MLAPLALFLTVVLPDNASPAGVLSKAVPFIGLAGLSFVASRIGADAGKRLERGLWCKWDGPPTTRFLRHTNEEFNAVTRRRIHTVLRRKGLLVPTLPQEQADPDYADECYEACVDTMRRATRDAQAYPLVYKRLIDYGHQRNALGLRWFGVSAAAVAGAGSVAYSVAGPDGPPTTALLLLLVLPASILFVLYWTLLTTESSVLRSANRYALCLLETANTLEDTNG